MIFRILLIASLLSGVAAAQPMRLYVGTLDSDSVTLAWGHASGTSRNTIGIAAEGSGAAKIRIGGQELNTEKSWLRVSGLTPDTAYPYEVLVAGKSIGTGTIRTWPVKADSLVFFVIGDYGNGKAPQYEIAARMEKERQAREKAGQPVRFVLTTGDNIYSGGSQDRDWELKFFKPYADLLQSIPFYATPGNHDGNGSESRRDLPAYLDNFFFPGGIAARWYHFSYGGLAEFYALDTTNNQFPGRPAPSYLPDGEQSAWLKKALEQPALPWRIAAMHHPLFTAGPDHPPALLGLEHWLELWQNHGVSVVFAGHEHNLQFSERNTVTGRMQFVVSGAGGQLRLGNVLSKMKQRNIAAWAAKTHFLVVEIRGDTMRITPVGATEINLVDSQGKPAKLPWVVPRRTK
ncbi:MAG: metallophosphoesterase [Bryobacteraceae bacterium]